MDKKIEVKEYAIKDLAATELKVFLTLCSLEKPEDIDNKELAHLTDITLRAVQYKVKSLQEKGFIQKAKDKKGFKVIKGK